MKAQTASIRSHLLDLDVFHYTLLHRTKTFLGRRVGVHTATVCYEVQLPQVHTRQAYTGAANRNNYLEGA